MKRHTLMIADGSEDIRKALQAQFDDFCNVICCSSGRKALELIEQTHPDILLLDLMLPELDGLSLLQAVSATGEQPLILAESSYVSTYILESAEALGVRYLFQPPLRMDKVKEALLELLRLRETGSGSDIYRRVSGLLLRLGFTAKLKGYSYLRDAVIQYMADPCQSIIKELYPRVAANYDVTPEDVEHSIRSAVAEAWSHGAKAVWNRCFCSEVLETRPSNAALIQGIVRNLSGISQAEAQVL